MDTSVSYWRHLNCFTVLAGVYLDVFFCTENMFQNKFSVVELLCQEVQAFLKLIMFNKRETNFGKNCTNL